MMKLFEKNIGDADRAARVVLALALVVAGIFLLSPPLTYAAFIIAIVLAVTGATRSCGAYTLLGINTMETKEAKPSRRKR